MSTQDVIHELRIKNGLSQDDLAEKVFVTRQAVSRWENGETSNIKRETLIRMSEKFGVNPMWLMGFPVLKQKRTAVEDDLVAEIDDMLARMDEAKLRKVIKFMNEFL